MGEALVTDGIQKEEVLLPVALRSAVVADPEAVRAIVALSLSKTLKSQGQVLVAPFHSLWFGWEGIKHGPLAWLRGETQHWFSFRSVREINSCRHVALVKGRDGHGGKAAIKSSDRIRLMCNSYVMYNISYCA